MLGPEEQLDVGRRLQAGDRDAWAALYEHYSVAVWKLTARLIGSDSAGVADVVLQQAPISGAAMALLRPGIALKLGSLLPRTATSSHT